MPTNNGFVAYTDEITKAVEKSTAFVMCSLSC
jgi:hypothetical protein